MFTKIFEQDKRNLLVLFLVQIITGILPIALVYLMSLIIDIVSTSTSSTYLINIIILISCYTLLLFLDEVLSIVHTFFSSYFEEQINFKIKFLLLEKISSYPTLELQENPEYANIKSLLDHNSQQLGNYVSLISQLVKGIFTLIPAVITAVSIKWWIPVVLILTLFPICYAKIYFQKKLWYVKENFAKDFNKMSLYEDCLSSKEYAKDLKVFSMHTSIIKKWSDLYKNIISIVNKQRKEGIFYIFTLGIFGAIGVCVCFLYVTINTIKGKFSLGELTLLFGIIFQLRIVILDFIYGAGEIITVSLTLKPLLKILNAPVPNILNTKEINLSNNFIEILNVSFTYRETDRVVIDDLSLSIKKGTSLAIVGKNGSGKTTLIKLLCKLYTPQAGKIIWNNEDIRSMRFEDHFSRISTMFQDFAKFPLTARTNINARNQLIKDEELNALMKKIGLEEILHNKLEHYLSKNIDNGLDLSGGQWQKIAIARMVLDLNRNHTELTILDEPTSALDAVSEEQIMKIIKAILKVKTKIIISLRLFITRFVDRIIVMDGGKIVEDGNHQELMELNGAYSGMFEKQAEYYL